MGSDHGKPLTDFLSENQASRLTPSAKRLTKEGMLNAMHSYASGGTLSGGLDKSDILSIRDAFRERSAAVGVESGGGGSCCCCCAASDVPSTVGALRVTSVSDVRQAFAMASGGPDDGEGGGSCCCCCL